MQENVRSNTWTTSRSGSGKPVLPGERAYFAIREATKVDWRHVHAEGLRRPRDAGESPGLTSMPRRQPAPPGRRKLLGATGSDWPDPPGNRTKRSGRMVSWFKRVTIWEWSILAMAMAIILDFFLDLADNLLPCFGHHRPS